MSKKGENIYKRKDKRWEGRYVKNYSLSGKIQFGYVYAKTYREAKIKLLERQTAEKINPRQERKKRKFGEYCDEWLTLNRNRVKEATYVKYHNIIKLHIKPELGMLYPRDLSTVIVEELSNRLLTGETKSLEKGLSLKTVRDILTILRSILCYMKKQIGVDFPEIEVVYPKMPKRDIRVLSKDEQTRLIHYLLSDMDRCKFGVLLALLTGMRIGEICALRWADISLSEGFVCVSSTMQRIQTLGQYGKKKTKILISDPKSESSKRIIPLTEQAVKLCFSMRSTDPSEFVLTGDSEHWMEPRTLQYRLEHYTKACGLENVHFHVLRHSFATRCVEVGFEIKSLSEILGHSSVKVTLDRYVHPSMDLKRENMRKLSVIGL